MTYPDRWDAAAAGRLLLALGASPGEVRQVTAMAVKAARVLLGTLHAGGPRFLEPADLARLESRPDEHYRQAVLRERREP